MTAKTDESLSLALDTLKRKTEKRKKRRKKTVKSTAIKPPEKYKRKWGNQFSLLYTEEEIEKLADRIVNFFKNNKDAVYFTDFSSFEMIARQRLYEFIKQSEYFKYCYEITKGIIIGRFVAFGLGGKNAVFPIFGLKNIASDEFKDKQEIAHTGGVTIIKDDIIQPA